MSPGRASSALTILRPLLPCSALRTHVCTAAQPPPGILCPACSSDQVMNDAHHGLPGATFAAARYSSTCGPRFAPPVSRTPLLRLGDGQRRGTERAAASAGRSDRVHDGTGAATGAAAAARLESRSLASASLVLVAVAVLLGRPLDVGDPLAVGVRVVDRLARRHPLRS